jgi:hypothetical protein
MRVSWKIEIAWEIRKVGNYEKLEKLSPKFETTTEGHM